MVKHLFSTLFKSDNKKNAPQKANFKTSDSLNSLKSEQDIANFIEIHNTLDEETLTLAFSKLKTSSILEKLAQSKQAETRKRAKQKLIEPVQITESIESINDTHTLKIIACYSEEETTAVKAMRVINDEKVYFSIVSEQADPKTRLLAAQHISDAAMLADLQKRFLNKDKALHKHCKQALNRIKQEQENQEKEKLAITNTLNNLQSWVKVGYEPELKSKLKVSDEHWNEFSLQNEQQRSQYQTLFAQLSELIESEQQKQQEIKAQQEAEQKQKTEHADLLNKLTELANNIENYKLDEIQDLFAKLQTQANELTPKHKDSGTLFKSIEQYIQAHKSLQSQHDLINTLIESTPKAHIKTLAEQAKKIERVQKQINWPEDKKQPEILEALQDKAKEITQQQKSILQEQPTLLKQYQQQIQELEAHIDGGKSKEAHKLLKKLNQTENKLTDKSVAPFKTHIQSLKSQLNDMQHWQNFAVTPKKEALCEQMQALCESQLPAPDLAQAIKNLQHQWKELGRGEHEKVLWERFHALADKAFEPCKAYFQEETNLRKRNLEKRKQLTQQLLDYEQKMNWQQADWKVVQKTLQQAQTAFKQLSPVDNNEQKQSVSEFKQAQDAVYEHLKQEYDKNLAKKAALIEQAEKLTQQEDSKQAADSAKTLQQQWQQIGICPRGPDQALWKQFRGQCDIIFANLKQSIQADKQAVNDEIKQFEERLKQTQEINWLDADKTQKSEFLELKQNIINADLPKGASEKLLKQWRSLDKQHQDALKAQQQAQHQQAWHNLLQLISDLDAKRPADKPSALPKHYDYEELVEKNTNAQLDDEKARTLCIALEILENIDSPKEDEALRMQYQVERLRETMGKTENKVQQKQAIIEQWVSIDKSEKWIERFKQSLLQDI